MALATGSITECWHGWIAGLTKYQTWNYSYYSDVVEIVTMSII